MDSKYHPSHASLLDKRWVAASDDSENVPPPQASASGSGRNASSAVPFLIFVEALQRAVDCRFSDQQLISEYMSDSKSGSRVKGSDSSSSPTAISTTSSIVAKFT